MNRNIFHAITLIGIVALMTGCTKEVPPGCYGRRLTPAGWDNKLIPPGRVQCFGRDNLYTVESRDRTDSVVLQVLLAEEKINFKVTLQVTYTLKDDSSVILPLFDMVRPSSGDARLISLEDIFATWALPVVESGAKKLLRIRTTFQILSEANRLEADISSLIVSKLEHSPLKIKQVTIVDMDFPDFITALQEKKKAVDIAIGKEADLQAARLKEIQNELALEETRYQEAILDAQMVATEIRRIGSSLTGDAGRRYQRLHEFDEYGAAASGPNNVLILPMQVMLPDYHQTAH